MNLAVTLRKSLVSSPIVAGAAYAGLVAMLLAIAARSLIDLFNQRASVVAAAAMLEQLEGRKPLSADQRPARAGCVFCSASPDSGREQNDDP